ncbi:arsenate reductase ArsC [Paenibacillus timonensis]|uniref:Arsenate reductase ArsC n=1 Tax=Paenibacillus timonensis TaxID=225915 RepID=A0ABW3S9M0_9BACL|nr:arsenate reductase ArsC [Paenibacillus timonensis]MCH1638909.1 arsenate reductase ArsC [Paenibacillus timonensis]
MKKPVRLYFLCFQNRCRSQIAEAFAKHYGGDQVISQSAGLEASEIHPYTVEVMKEVGIDISTNVSKQIDMKTFMSSNAIVKLCEQLNEKCPIVPFGIMNVQWDIPDPLHGGGLEDVRRARDEIKQKVIELLRGLNISVNG